jgi:DNA repair protein RadC
MGVSPQIWADSLLLSRAVGIDLAQTLEILVTAGGLGALFQMGHEDLQRCGLSEPDRSKIVAFMPLAVRLLSIRAGSAVDNSSRRQVADELVYRGLQFTQVSAGVLAWNAQGVRVVDRIIAIGTKAEAILDFQAILRTVLCSNGGVSALVWLWRPVQQVYATPEDRRNADEIRVQATVVGVQIADFMLLGFGESVSLAVVDQWQQ